MRLPREFSLGFDTITAYFRRCSDLLPEVSPVFDRTEAILGDILSTYASFPEVFWKCVPPVSSLSGSVPSRNFWRCTKLLLELSPVFDRTEATLGEIFPTYTSLPEISLEMRPLRESSLGFGAIKVSFWCCSDLLPEVSPVFDRTEATLGEVFPPCASLPEVSLKMRPPREFSFGFGTIKAYFWCCSDLLPEVSPVFDHTETIYEEIFPTHASLAEVSLEIRPPRESSLGFGIIKAYFCRCTILLPEASPALDCTEATLGGVFPTYASLPEVSLEMRPPREFSLGFGTIKAPFLAL